MPQVEIISLSVGQVWAPGAMKTVFSSQPRRVITARLALPDLQELLPVLTAKA